MYSQDSSCSQQFGWSLTKGNETRFLDLQPTEAQGFNAYSITVRPAAPQTTLWGSPGPRLEPGTGDLEAGTLLFDIVVTVQEMFCKSVTKQGQQ